MGMPPEINWVDIYFTQTDPIKRCSFFFPISKMTFFWSRLVDLDTKLDNHFKTKKPRNTALLLSERKVSSPNNTFWVRNKNQIINSLCVLHLVVYFSLLLFKQLFSGSNVQMPTWQAFKKNKRPLFLIFI